jgi:hypothetical protein
MLKTKQNCKSKSACQVKMEATIADPKDAPTTLPTNCTRIKQKMMKKVSASGNSRRKVLVSHAHLRI